MAAIPLVLALGGCGDEDSGTSGATETTAVEATIELRELRAFFDPARQTDVEQFVEGLLFERDRATLERLGFQRITFDDDSIIVRFQPGATQDQRLNMKSHLESSGLFLRVTPSAILEEAPSDPEG